MQIKNQNKAQCRLVFFPALFLASALFLSPALSSADLEEEVRRKRGILRGCTYNCYEECKRNKRNKRTRCSRRSCRNNECIGEKQAYQDAKDRLDNPKGDETSDENTDGDVGTKIKRASKKTNILAYAAAGTTLYLGYRCSVGLSSPGDESEWWACPMSILAGQQTYQMFKKKGDLDRTDCEISDQSKSKKCDDGGRTETTPTPSTPSFCPPGKKNCRPPTSTLPPPGTDNDPRAGSAELIAGDIAKLFGIPKEQRPFLTEKFDYNKLTKGQKNAIKKAMAPINKKNKAFLAKHGFPEEEDSSSVVEDLEEEDPDLSSLSGAFTDGESDGSPPGLQADLSPKSLKKKDPLDIKKIMNDLFGKKDGGGDSLKDNSVKIGNDLVGGREDNIFLMVHRRHRAMDQEHYFIKEAF